MYIKRVAEQTLHRYLKAFPVVGITGPRQAGKSTLLQHALPDYKYVTFDDPKNILSFTDDPEGYLKQYAKHVIFDEVQYVPEIFHYIKMRVDKNRMQYGNYILTGSSQFQFLQHVTESLAGRIGLISLLPFQYVEVPPAWRLDSIWRGALPELVVRQYHASDLWYGAWLETYLSKDIRALANIGDLRDLHRFIQLLAAQVTQTFDMSFYARDIGVSVPTIKRWISILEASYVVFLLPPFYHNYGKRIIKSPKVYFYDTGIVSWLTGIKTSEQFDQGPLAGALFENYIVSEILKKELHTGTQSELYYFRTQDRAEIDLIVDKKSTKDFIEIKKHATFQPRLITTLSQYAEKEKNARCLLLYTGEEYMHRNVKALPYWDYLSA